MSSREVPDCIERLCTRVKGSVSVLKEALIPTDVHAKPLPVKKYQNEIQQLDSAGLHDDDAAVSHIQLTP